MCPARGRAAPLSTQGEAQELLPPMAKCLKPSEADGSGVNLKENGGEKKVLLVFKKYFPALFDRSLFKPALAAEQNVAARGRCHSHLPGRARFEQSDAASNSSCVSAKEVFFFFWLSEGKT